jgi:MFS transporter, FSR family, fosmidomycin resistance protein
MEEMGSLVNTEALARKETGAKVAFTVLAAISFCHLLNDMVQSLIPAIYPILKSTFHLDFSQLGLITLTFQATASLLQPFIGLYADRRPKPYSLVVGMGCTLVGLLLLSRAWNFGMILISSALVGVGSSVFHPESSRVARMASGGQHGLAQSLFQVGGNTGSALGPLLAAFIVVPHGQHSISWFSAAALAAIVLLINVGHWYKRKAAAKPRAGAAHSAHGAILSSKRVLFSIVVLAALVFSKYIYLVSLSNYYTFYLMSKFHVSVRTSQIYLFVFLGAVAAGTIIGGPVGDRIGRKLVIWCSILGALPFSLALPYANLFWTSILTVAIGVILASAFSAIIVYAQELVPGKIGMISGLFFGFAFGVAGLGAALLGQLADHTSIRFVYQICSYLPAIGLLTALLPNVEPAKARRLA